MSVNVTDLRLFSIAGALTMGCAGWLGGRLIKTLNNKVSPAAHGLTAGFWVPAGAVLWKTAEKLFPENRLINGAFALLGGYFASWSGVKLAGYSVTPIGPFLSLTVLAMIGPPMIFVIESSVLLTALAIAGLSIKRKK